MLLHRWRIGLLSDNALQKKAGRACRQRHVGRSVGVRSKLFSSTSRGEISVQRGLLVWLVCDHIETQDASCFEKTVGDGFVARTCGVKPFPT